MASRGSAVRDGAERLPAAGEGSRTGRLCSASSAAPWGSGEARTRPWCAEFGGVRAPAATGCASRGDRCLHGAWWL